MKIWIDNDGCPKIVRELVFRTGGRLGIKTSAVANSYMRVPPGPLYEMITVPGSFDAADDYIATHVAAGDLVITADVPLADRVVGAGATALSPHGEVFDAQNIKERLAMRNLLAELRSGGEVSGGPPPYGDGDKKRFADALDRLATSLARASQPSG